MAVEIGVNGGFGESVSLSGTDAVRFVSEIIHPPADDRRLSHLKRSDETFERLFAPNPISELPAEAP